MKISGICFTQSGRQLAERIHRILTEVGETEVPALTWYAKGKNFTEESALSFTDVKEPMQEWAGRRFNDSDALIFIGAAGIAVRAIAPHVRDKRSDPAVIVLDEQGKFCISLLSGHIGGANELVTKIAEGLNSIPVITTATDVNDLFAVDVYATKHHMTISSMTYAKEVSAALLAGEPVGFFSTLPVAGDLPKGIFRLDQLDEARADRAESSVEGTSLGIYISPSYERAYFDHTLWLIPRCLSIGVGCKKHTPVHKIKDLVMQTLQDACLYPEAICAVTSIDVKKDEPGLAAFAEELQVPFITYSAEELLAVEGDFTASDFVQKNVGVDNVCERSAMLHSRGRLLVRKTSKDGVTCAVAVTKDPVSLSY